MPVQLIRKVRDSQPRGLAKVVPEFCPAEIFLPQSGGVNLASGVGFPKTAFWNTRFDRNGAFFKRIGADYNDAITFPVQTAEFMSILVVSESLDTNRLWGGNEGNTIRTNASNFIELYSSSAVVTLTPAASLPYTKGSVVFVQWKSGEYVVCHKNGDGVSEYLTASGLLGSTVPNKWGRTGTPGAYLFARWPNRKFSNSQILSLVENPWQIFEPETIPLFFSTVTAQYARPTSDVSAGTWTASTGSDLYAMLDETSANDTDYIVTTNVSTCEVALGTLSDPASSSGHIVRYRIAADSGGITVRLRQGTTTIATWTHASAPTSLTTYEQTLTGGEADSISDYSALRLQFEATT